MTPRIVYLLSVFFFHILQFFHTGLCKGYLGLFYAGIGNWGLSEMVTSTKINSYYENELKGQDVVYDDLGRPVHPQTHKPVRMFSRYVHNMI